ncbi:hypothetical protein FOZ61_006434 [Perkinsus olseni]|uniref:Prefoldin subunit 1 n=1 Tax=Perkinsus olseni TaxID=32597 RepID=A0A7J6LNX8_PEROL|nr:hypothetical protein FOZ61_006434 [Perkinsus olseni]KAF4660989.1 hypothetical protein FOL46_005893 [Perkinsus olseni]
MGKPKTRANHAAAREKREEKRARKAEARQKNAQEITDSIKRQYSDAERSYISMTEQVEKLSARIMYEMRERRLAELSQKHLAEFQEIDDETSTTSLSSIGGVNRVRFFRPSGRMFVISDRKEMLDSAETVIRDCEELIPKLKGIHQRFTEKQNEAKRNVEDILEMVEKLGGRAVQKSASLAT